MFTPLERSLIPFGIKVTFSPYTRPFVLLIRNIRNMTGTYQNPLLLSFHSYIMLHVELYTRLEPNLL
jgi:hypothetical protein